MTVPHIERMQVELQQLSERATKLREFIAESPIFNQLSTDEKGLMRGQLSAMSEYHDILETRIDLAVRQQ